MAANTQIVPKPRLLAGAEPPDGVPVKLLRVAKTAETFGAVMTTLVSEPSSQLKAWKHFAVNLERDFGTNDTALESATGAAFNNSLQDSEVVPAGSPASTIQKDTLVEKMTQALKDGTFKAIPDGAGRVVESTVVAEIETATEALNTAVLDAVVNPPTLVEVTLVPSPSLVATPGTASAPPKTAPSATPGAAPAQPPPRSVFLSGTRICDTSCKCVTAPSTCHTNALLKSWEVV